MGQYLSTELGQLGYKIRNKYRQNDNFATRIYRTP